MDFLDDLFNSSTLPSDRISRMLEEDLFWLIIENSLLNANNLQDQETALIQELENLTAEDIIGFQLRLEFYSYSLHSPEIWCAACIMNDDTDPKHFFYFKNWIISQGQELFEKAILNPDNLADYFNEGFNEDDLYEFEEFHLIADTVFYHKFQHKIIDFVDKEYFKFFTEKSPKPDFDWDDENLINLQIICPRLFKVFIEDYSPDDDEMEDDFDDEDEFL
ncbi:DUF4240 domain-containing protein [Empedobacter tilapiae]|uniref:DUF4240 domain-containing protein n=1 Tax=Empedobacter tilapiae TaxID=2491114 RepID=A0A4Z1BD44_9FLAO|nr:DUF4240 domain-containing protein [Empedobacter tilapiae]TGN23070.1 DUF4240 domain-containing protein [Empedobacter tilapiae]